MHEPPLNPVLEHVLEGRHGDAVALFESLEAPSAEDQAWAGLAMLNLNRLLEGTERLLEARALGFEEAAVHLLTAYRFLDESHRAEALLLTIQVEQLSVLGQATLARERGVLAHVAGRFEEARLAFEAAWALAQSDPVARRVISPFASSLGLVLADVGRDQQALAYLDRALAVTKGSRAYLLAARGFCLTNTGAFEQAKRDLEDAMTEAHTKTPVAVGRVRFVQGMLARTRGLLEEAFTEQLEVAALARSNGDAELECGAELELAALCTENDDLPGARAHVARARALAQGVRNHALLALRAGAILARAGRDQTGEAVKTLTLALEAFELRGLEADAGVVYLHLAEVMAQEERRAEARDHLLRAADARHALGSGTVFARELRGLHAALELLTLAAPEASGARGRSGSVRRTVGLGALLEDWRTLEATASGQVALHTLGGYGLVYNEVPVRVNTGLARTVETLAYLLEHGESSLEAIRANVFTDVQPERAQRYVHVIRQQVAKAIPGLSVPFEPNGRLYRVAADGLRLRWDVHEVREAIRIGGELGLRRVLALYAGPFLPRSSNEWAENLRTNLEFEISALGAEALENLYRLGRFEACVELAAKLLEVNRLAVGVWKLLVDATRAWRGAVAGEEVLEQAKRVLLNELGEVPEALIGARGAARTDLH